MDTLKTYLTDLYQELPDTPANRKAQAELLDAMTTFYNQQRQRGKDEDAAIGATLKATAGIKTRLAQAHAEASAEPAARPAAQAKRNVPVERCVTMQQAETFWQAAGTHALAMAGGVFLLIVGSGFTIVGDSGHDWSMVAFYIPVLLGIAALILSSKAFKAARRPLRHLPVAAAVHDQAIARRAAYHRRYVIGQSAGYVSLAAALLTVALDSGGNEGTFLMAVLIGLGVFCLVYVHSIDRQYKRLAHRRIGD
ncbi:hypothetical protein ACFQ3L_02800 [Lacticaseibacillus jixianensis]|uniref:DUF1700 domain-containing protein n=1 Tax=Lacticaseibacillus jixianensis TaxID=2486012 RepID=A0ABW4B8M1_9LACO|nr:hypothetical protein [Lacticaseibacillus jixianensis]